MSRYPGARWRPVARYLPDGSSAVAMTRYDGGIDHTYVGSPSPDSAFSRFNTPGTPTPHFMVFRDGSIDQYIDTRFRSSACLDGNYRLITWETADGFPGLWTDGQAPKDTAKMVKAKARLMVWLHKEHGIPLVQMPSSRSRDRGFGWHRLGIDGNFEQVPGQLLGGRVADGEHWSTSFGKTCPTSRRIRQFVNETIPAAVALTQPDPASMTGVIVQSGHNTATADQLTAALTSHKKTLDRAVPDGASKVILLTEQAADKFAAPLTAWADANDMNVYHPTARGADECAILSSRPLKHQTYFKLTDLTLDPKVTHRTAPLFVIAAKPEGDDWIGVWHSPAHSDGLKPRIWATKVYLSALDGLKRWRMTVKGRPSIGGDFNADPNRDRILKILTAKFPRMHWAGEADQQPTEGGRVIDGLLTRRKVLRSAETLRRQEGFDHKPVLIVLG